MYLNEVPKGRTRDDLAMVIEEMLKQRILGVKNEKGVYITPAFPKLIYVLEEDNLLLRKLQSRLLEFLGNKTAQLLSADIHKRRQVG